MADETLSIKLNGTEIADRLELTTCLLYDRYGGELDEIYIAFPYSSNDIAINRMDKLQVRYGYYDSGIMFVDGVNHVNDTFTIKAIAAKPINKTVKTDLWKFIGLLQIAGDVAGKCGLSLKSYSVSNFVYSSVFQRSETDLQFLRRICEREGCCVKCFNENLIVYSEYQIENNPDKKMKLAADEISGGWDFDREINCLNSFTVSCFDSDSGAAISYTATDANIPDGGSKSVVERVKDAGEAERFAKGYLRAANKNHVTGELSMDIKSNISACTVIELGSDFNEFAGNYVVYEVAHDIVRKVTTAKVRQVLSY